jgi:O-antigen ligase
MPVFGRWSVVDVACASLVVVFIAVRMPGQAHLSGPQVAAMASVALIGLRLLITDAANRDRLAAIALLLMAVGLASSLLATAPIVALIGTVGGHTSLLTYAGGVATFAISRRVTSAGRTLVSRTFVASVALTILVAVLQIIVQPSTTTLRLVDGRPGGLSGHPVHLATFSAGLVAFSGWKLVHDGDRRFVMAIGLGAFGAGLASSRVAIAAGLLAVLLIVAFARAWRFLASIAWVIGTGLSVPIHALTSTSRGVNERDLTSGFDDRLTLWGYGLRGFSDHPLLGVGPGRFTEATQRYHSVAWTRRFGFSWWDDAHNVLVEVLVTWGLIGFILFTAFGVAIIRRGAGPFRMVILALACCWLLEPATAGTLGVLGISAGLAVGPVRARSVTWQATALERRTLVGIGSLAAGLVIIGGLVVERDQNLRDFSPLGASAAWYWRDPDVAREYAHDASTDAERRYWLERAVILDASNPRNRVELALFEIAIGDLGAARARAQQALDLEPNSFSAVTILHNVAIRTGDEVLLAKMRQRLCASGDQSFCRARPAGQRPADHLSTSVPQAVRSFRNIAPLTRPQRKSPCRPYVNRFVG